MQGQKIRRVWRVRPRCGRQSFHGSFDPVHKFTAKRRYILRSIVNLFELKTRFLTIFFVFLGLPVGLDISTARKTTDGKLLKALYIPSKWRDDFFFSDLPIRKWCLVTNQWYYFFINDFYHQQKLILIIDFRYTSLPIQFATLWLRHSTSSTRKWRMLSYRKRTAVTYLTPSGPLVNTPLKKCALSFLIRCWFHFAW